VGAKISTNLALTHEEREYARMVGRGSISMGVGLALKLHRERENSTWVAPARVVELKKTPGKAMVKAICKKLLAGLDLTDTEQSHALDLDLPGYPIDQESDDYAEFRATLLRRMNE